MNRKEEQLRDDLKRMLIVSQLWKVALETIRVSETIKERSEAAKKNKNKAFIDLRALAADQLRTLQSYMLRLKQSMTPETFTALITDLNGGQLDEINLLIDNITYLDENSIAGIRKQVEVIVKDIKNKQQ